MSHHGKNLAYSLLLVAFIVSSTAYGQTVRVDTDHATNSFIPNQALGAGIDRMPAAAAEKYFGQPALPAVLAAGWQPVTYRQNTELAVEAWHWNPQGHVERSQRQGLFHRQRDSHRNHLSIPTVIRCLIEVSRAMRVPRPTVIRA